LTLQIDDLGVVVATLPLLISLVVTVLGSIRETKTDGQMQLLNDVMLDENM
jgi:hypothetical protein